MSLNPRYLPALFMLSVLALGLALMMGCGGGGGGGGGGGNNNNNSGATLSSGYYYYGVSSTTSPALSPGDQVTLTASVTVNSVTSALSPYNFVVQGGSAVATVTTEGVLTAASGITAGSSYTVTASTNEGSVSWTFTGAAPLAQPVVLGIVEDDSTPPNAIPGAVVTAYDASGNVVGTGTSGSNGLVVLNVSSAAVTFGVSDSGISNPSSYYSAFTYGLSSFSYGKPTCLPSLPALTGGNHHYSLPNPIQVDLQALSPPPPPGGCFGS